MAIIAMLFLGSSVIRLASGTGAAIALEVVAKKDDMPAQAAASTPQSCSVDPDLATYIDVLNAREAEVAAREQAASEREAVLDATRTEVLERLAQLEAVEQKLAATMASASVAAEDDLGKLTTVYENMKSKDAAPLFDAMEPDFAAGFLSRMRPEAAAAIMAGLTPEKAYSISVVLAGRNAGIPLK
ncbi:MotE family protein [Aquimixticola soesokkakensis]|uniref:MotE family protein n=1 Tax=Aquimixticola soesokkakensis TaxID=1519096 RepID=UPI001F44889A|nr:hypothetical protein [Aquimixticola soesokkakensis]